MDNIQPYSHLIGQLNWPYTYFTPETNQLHQQSMIKMNSYLPFYSPMPFYNIHPNSYLNIPFNQSQTINQVEIQPNQSIPIQKIKPQKKKTFRYHPVTVRFQKNHIKIKDGQQVIVQQKKTCRFYDPVKAPAYIFQEQDIYDPLKFNNRQVGQIYPYEKNIDKHLFANLQQNLLALDHQPICLKKQSFYNSEDQSFLKKQPLNKKIKKQETNKDIYLLKAEYTKVQKVKKILKFKKKDYMKRSETIDKNFQYQGQVDDFEANKIITRSSKRNHQTSHILQERNYKQQKRISKPIQEQPLNYSQFCENEDQNDQC